MYILQLTNEDNAEAAQNVEIIQPLRRNVQLAQQYMQHNQFMNIVDVLSQVIDVSVNCEVYLWLSRFIIFAWNVFEFNIDGSFFFSLIYNQCS